jgi:hypothetical protein
VLEQPAKNVEIQKWKELLEEKRKDLPKKNIKVDRY